MVVPVGCQNVANYHQSAFKWLGSSGFVANASDKESKGLFTYISASMGFVQWNVMPFNVNRKAFDSASPTLNAFFYEMGGYTGL